MGLVTNDEAVFGPGGDRVLDANSLIDEGHQIVLDHPDAFHPVLPAEDEGVARTSAVYADPNLQAEGQPPAPDLPKGHAEQEKQRAAATASLPVVPTGDQKGGGR